MIIMTEFLIRVASVDVTAETNSFTDSADRKHVIPSRVKINNDKRGVRYRTIARHPFSKTRVTKIGDVTINTTKHVKVATSLLSKKMKCPAAQH